MFNILMPSVYKVKNIKSNGENKGMKVRILTWKLKHR